MTRRIAAIVLILVVLPALVGGVSFALWRWAEHRMARGFSDWETQMVAAGWTVRRGRSSSGGWPFAAEFSVEGLIILGGEDIFPGGVEYHGTRATIRWDPLKPDVLTARAEGQQSLRVGFNAALPFTADRLEVTVSLLNPTSAGLDAAKLAFSDPVAGLTIGLLQSQADWHDPKKLALRVSAEAIALPPQPASQFPLGPYIASATVEGDFAGVFPTNPDSPAAGAAAWRDSGGAVALRRIAVGWGPLGLSGSANLKLDKSLQPDVAADLRLVGLDETLSALAAVHTITPRAAQTAKAVVGLMAQAPQGGAAVGVTVPLTLHDGSVAVGAIPLASVGKLDWPDPP